MCAELTDPHLCGFPEANVELQVNAPGGTVKVAIERFFKHREKDGLLVLCFAGHGVIDAHRRLTLALNETDPDIRATGVEARFRAKKTLVLRDEKIERLLTDAADKRRTRNLTIPRAGEERVTLDDYRTVLVLNSDDAKVREGVRQIAEYFAAKAEEAIAEGQWDRVEELASQEPGSKYFLREMPDAKASAPRRIPPTLPRTAAG